MREIGKKTIGNNEYQVSDWSPVKALRWQRRIIPRIAKAAALASGSFKGGLDSLDGKSLAEAVDVIFDGLSENEFVEWTKELTEGVLFNGKPLAMESDFHGGNIMELNLLMAFVIQHQFRDFFQGANGALGKVLSLAANKMSIAGK
jgi:hypothetical protein